MSLLKSWVSFYNHRRKIFENFTHKLKIRQRSYGHAFFINHKNEPAILLSVFHPHFWSHIRVLFGQLLRRQKVQICGLESSKGTYCLLVYYLWAHFRFFFEIFFAYKIRFWGFRGRWSRIWHYFWKIFNPEIPETPLFQSSRSRLIFSIAPSGSMLKKPFRLTWSVLDAEFT